MTAKEYLMQVGRADWHIDILKRELGDLRMRLYPGGSDLTGDRVQSNHDPDKFGSITAKMDEVEQRIKTEIGKYLDIRERISGQILAMPNKRTAEILYCRYILLMRWEEIAAEKNTGLRWVYRLHGQGLVEFANQYKRQLNKPLRGH